jgi:hypothetical protein
VRPGDINALIEALRLPPGNVSRSLGQLRNQQLAVRRSDGRWSLTPVGTRRAMELLGDIDAAALEPQLRDLASADMGQEALFTLAPALAPTKWQRGIAQLLESHAFETNVFCMLRFPDPADNDDPNGAAVTAIREALTPHGLSLHLASDRVIDDDLWGNIAAHMWACQYGVGLFESRTPRGLNYNLLIEIGSMLITGRRCALLKDTTAPNMPTDLLGQIYKPVDLADTAAVAETIHKWAADDLGLGRCSHCPPPDS